MKNIISRNRIWIIIICRIKGRSETYLAEVPGDQTGSLLASLAFFAAFVVMLKKAKEQQEEMAKRVEQLLMDYPSLIMKFTLLIQAGMTARKVFQKMSADYMRNRFKDRTICV